MSALTCELFWGWLLVFLTYMTLFDMLFVISHQVKKYAHKEPSRKGPQSRDHRRALELKVPFTIDEIIESPVETFNEMLNAHKLTEAQVSDTLNDRVIPYLAFGWVEENCYCYNQEMQSKKSAC